MRTNIRRGSVAAACAVVSAVALSSLVPGSGADPVKKADPASVLGVLREAPAAVDRVAPTDRQYLASVAENHKLDLAASRAVVAPASEEPLRLIPGEGEDAVCISLPDPVDGAAIGCATQAEVEQGRLWTGLVNMPGQDAGDARIAIVVPDGVPSVETVDTDGVRTVQPAHDNVVVANLEDVAAYELTVDGDAISVPLYGTPEEPVAP